MNLLFSCIKALCELKKPDKNAEKNCALRAVAISDTHITKALYRRMVLIPGIKKLKKFSPDVVIFAGDSTDNGNTGNWNAFRDIIEKHCNIKERIIALGNHDTWITYASGHDYLPAKENYLNYSNFLMETQHKEVYFRCEQQGYSFFVLGTEGTSVAANISDEQLLWLSGELKKTDKNKPVFVINHHPMNFTHGVGDNEHSMGFNGESSDKLKKILGEYKNIIYICGHVHLGFGENIKSPKCYSTVEKIGNNTSITLPSYEYGSLFEGGSGNPLIGTALLMDISDKKVSLKGINLLLGKEIKSFRHDIILN